MGSQILPIGPSQSSRNLAILAVCLLTLLVFGPSLKTVISLALSDDRYLQIAAAPLACSLLLFRQRTEIISRARYSPGTGIPLLSLTVLLGALSVYSNPGSERTGLLLAVLAAILVWMAAFVLCFGVRSFRAGLYPLCCMFLMIPLPSSWMDRVAVIAQL